MSGPTIGTAREATADESELLQFVERTGKEVAPLGPPGMWHNFGEGVGDAAMQGLAKTGRAAMMGAGAFVVAGEASHNVGRGLRGLPETHDAADWYFGEVVDGLGTDAVDEWTPNAANVGAAGQTLNGLVMSLVPLAVGGGNPAPLLGTVALDTPTDLLNQGADLESALGVASVQTAATAIGVRLPAAWGSTLLQRIGTGAGGNLAVGAASRELSQRVLLANGEKDLAERYGGDASAAFLDLGMGAVFGAVAHARAPRPISKAEIAAVLTSSNSHHFQEGTMPGAAADTATQTAHGQAMELAVRQLLNGERVDVAGVLPEGGMAYTVASRPPSAIQRPRTGVEAGAIIDERLSALDVAAREGLLNAGEVRSLVLEQEELSGLLRTQDAAKAQGVQLAPGSRLTVEERAFAETRRVEVRQQLEKHRAAQSQGAARAKLRRQLSNIDRDADLVALSERLAPSAAPAGQGLTALGVDAPPARSEGSYDAFRIALESGGVANARAPTSGAFGIDQFIPGTWRRVVAKARPAWAEGLTDAQLLAARADPSKSAEMERVLRSENAQALEEAGQDASSLNLYAAHHFGGSKGVAFARAADDTPMAAILTAGQIKANSYLSGLTKAEAIANWTARARKAGVDVPAGVRQAEVFEPLPADAAQIQVDPAVAAARAAVRPTTEELRSSVELFADPPPRPTPEEFSAWAEGRQRVALPAQLEQMRADLPRYEHDAAAAAEQARLRPSDDGAVRFADEQRAQLDTLRRRVSDGEAGKVEPLDPVVLEAARSDYLARDTRQTPVAGTATAEAERGAQVRAFLDDLDTRVLAGEPASAEFGGMWVAADADGFRVEGLRAANDADLGTAVARASEVIDRAGVERVLREAMRGADTAPVPSPAIRLADGQEYANAAMEAVDSMPGLLVADEDGTVRPAADFLRDTDAAVQQAEVEARALDAAVNCFLRSGT